MTLTFVQLSTFVADAKRLDLANDDIQALELILLKNPMAGVIVPGTGGVRKMRFAPPSWRTGKSGGSRVIYLLAVESSHIYFLLAYGKNEQANLSVTQKQMCSRLVRQLRRL